MQFLGVRAALEVYAAPAANVLLAYGASRYSAWANMLRLVVLAIGLLLTVPRYGMSAAIWVLVGAPALSYLALVPGLRRYVPTAMRLEFLTIILFLCGAGGALLLVVLGAAH